MTHDFQENIFFITKDLDVITTHASLANKHYHTDTQGLTNTLVVHFHIQATITPIETPTKPTKTE
jgi:hypothetical protein